MRFNIVLGHIDAPVESFSRQIHLFIHTNEQINKEKNIHTNKLHTLSVKRKMFLLTLKASRNLWLIMLYRRGLMHVDKKYRTPETYVKIV